MADPAVKVPGEDDMLGAVTAAIVALHKRYHGRRPARAHSQRMGEDMIACVLGDVYTDIEKTMIELQRTTLVHETRSTFQHAMKRRFSNEVERIAGRRITGSVSAHHVGPDLEIHLFMFEPKQRIDPVLPSHLEGQQ